MLEQRRFKDQRGKANSKNMFATLSARCWTMAVNSILVCALFVCVAHAQLSTVNMSQVVGSLARQFETIRNEGLGIDSMEVNVNVWFS